MNDETRFASDDDDLPEDGEFEVSENDASETTSVVGVLGEYLLLEPIGAGGMGQVFRAEHRTMNREVALKILSKKIAGRESFLQQFFSEIRAVAKLMHPNIVTAFDASSAGGVHYLVMELVDGEVLSARVRSGGPLSSAEAVGVLEQAAQALAYAHGLGIVHRDIKPANMMLTKDGVLKILDFGLARLGASESTGMSKNVFMGTPEYMSPEQIENADSVDGRSDLYSLGATLFFLLTGKSMFSGEQMQVARAQLHQKPTPLFVERGDVDLRLDAVFQRLVAKNPADRYAGAQELLKTLSELNLTSQPATGSSLQRGAYRLATDSPTSVAYDKSTLAKKSQVVAIDLGLMFTTAAYYDAQLGPQVISQGEGNAQHLRNMLWSSGENIKIGAEASALRQSDPRHVFHSLQRSIGSGASTRPFAGKNLPSEVLLAAILRQVMQHASSVSENSSSALVTVPGCYDQLHRRAIRNACRIAGIDLVQLLDRPLAAALGWLDVNRRLSAVQSSESAVDKKLLVVHLGGTGLDVSVVHVDGLIATQLGVCGHWKLGTQRWQHRLTEFLSAALEEKTGRSVRDDMAAATRLQRTVEMAMDRLTRTSKVDIRFDWHDTSIQQTVSQEGFLKIAPDLTKSLRQSITSACAIAKTELSDIDCILLAGSMMQMKPVQQIVTAMTPPDVEMAMLDVADFALGAAIQSHYVSALSTKDDMAPRAVGCTTYDIALLTGSKKGVSRTPRMLMEKARQIPSSLARTIRSGPEGGDNRAMPSLQLIESSSLGGSNWSRLGKIDPGEAFPERDPDDPLQLRLEVDENGILESSLLWAAGNKQVRLPASSEPELTEAELKSWRDWLETTMLCSES